MKKIFRRQSGVHIIFVMLLLILSAVYAEAKIMGIMGSGTLTVDLTAKADMITTPDGGSVMIWGYADDNNHAMNMNRATYPGPTLIVDEGTVVTINLQNDLPVPVSMVFPGQQGVVTTGGDPGILTAEVPPLVPGATVSYTFTASNPGTYLYHSGTQQELEIEMGLLGAFIVRPTMGANFAYNHADSQFDYEYLFLLSEMDINIHQIVEFYGHDAPQLRNSNLLSDYFASYWFINGRCAPDTMAMPFTSWLPTQPYNCMPLIHPGEKMLMRIIGGGRDLHPFHYHGNHARNIAMDGRLLESAPGSGADLGFLTFTTQSIPGKTNDLIFDWTGEGLGWDMYGHAPGDPMEPNEDPADHGKPIPVQLPADQELTFGGAYSGSPYLGSLGTLPPGEGGLNPNAGFAYMWHSHAEKEMTNYDIFPGGMMTMMLVVPHGVPIP